MRSLLIEGLIGGHRINVDHSSSTFPGGEEHVKIGNIDNRIDTIEISAIIKSSKDLMKLLLVKDAIDSQLVGKQKPFFHLIIPYLPYARQDRVTADGFAFSLRVVANMINSMNFDKVSTCDVHSNVALGLINNVKNENMVFVAASAMSTKKFTDCLSWSRAASNNMTLTVIAPDAGARKRAEEFAKIALVYAHDVEIIQATKERDPATGKIKGVKLHCDSLANKNNIIVVDDICDGGRTFIEVAKEAKKKGAMSMDLFVTHGIFSKGFDVLREYYSNIFTSNSWCGHESNELLNVFDVFSKLKEV